MVTKKQLPFIFANCHSPLASVNRLFKDAQLLDVTELTISTKVRVSGNSIKKFDKSISSHMQLQNRGNKCFNTIREKEITFTIKSELKKSIKRNIKSALYFKPNVITPVTNGVISDIGILAKGADNGEFENMITYSSAWGFTPWQHFNQGEYFFREMLMRLKITNNDPKEVNMVRIIKHTVSCDVEDLIDRAAVSIAAKESKIFFKKVFHCIPQVNVTSFVTQEFCVPQLIEVTKIYFIVKLVKSDNTLTSGEITYYAHGY